MIAGLQALNVNSVNLIAVSSAKTPGAKPADALATLMHLPAELIFTLEFSLFQTAQQ